MYIPSATVEAIVNYAITEDTELYNHLSEQFGEYDLLSFQADGEAVRKATIEYIIAHPDTL